MIALGSAIELVDLYINVRVAVSAGVSHDTILLAGGLLLNRIICIIMRLYLVGVVLDLAADSAVNKVVLALPVNEGVLAANSVLVPNLDKLVVKCRNGRGIDDLVANGTLLNALALLAVMMGATGLRRDFPFAGGMTGLGQRIFNIILVTNGTKIPIVTGLGTGRSYSANVLPLVIALCRINSSRKRTEYADHHEHSKHRSQQLFEIGFHGFPPKILSFHKTPEREWQTSIHHETSS